METLEEFIKKQEKELQKRREELAKLEELGPIPGLSPWLIHGKLYGIQHIAFKLESWEEFLPWAQANVEDIFAVEGFYKGFYPQIPVTRDYLDATIKTQGKIVVDYSTIMRRHGVRVFYKGYKLSFEVPDKKLFRNLKPNPRFTGFREEKIESWSKPTVAVQRMYLRVGEDKQSADLECLLDWTQFEFHRGG